MRFPILSAALAAICFALPATAQKVQVYNFPSQRACSTLLMFGESGQAALTITHGQPEWKAEYDNMDAMLPKLKGKVNRLGKDFWTTFMTSAAVEIGGVKVMPGSYVVGIHCDDKGQFALVMFEAGKAMKDGLMPWAEDLKPEIVCPVTLNKNVAKDAVAKMEMTLKAGEDPTKSTFTLAWGKHTLTAPIAIHMGK
ncbi:MAG: DUF2911 domain-containing protein [Planctomycetes bacterium]|jgi:hypothetical protein|nr:DUF2911 domain-containing protein [Planctomycetota bacterium]